MDATAWPSSCARPRSTTATTSRPHRSTTGTTGTPRTSSPVSAVAARTRRTRTPRPLWRRRGDDRRLRRPRPRRRRARASTAPRRSPPAACGSPSSSATCSAASARTGGASRPRPCCGRGRLLAAARDAPGAREAVTGHLDVRSALAWRDFMVSDYDDAGQVAWARGAGIDVVRGRGRLAGPGTVEVDGDGVHRRARRRRDRLGPGDPARTRPARAAGPVDRP